MSRLFGTDGIRGEAGRYPMDTGTAFSIGRAVARMFGQSAGPARVLIGLDTRASGPMLEGAIESGIASVGGIPYLAGVLPTPGIAFLTRAMEAHAGVVVSASHNPYRDNGIKIFSGSGFKLSDEQEAGIEDLILGAKPAVGPMEGLPAGLARPVDDAEERYVAFLQETLPQGLTMESVKVVLDTANGATHRVAPAVLRGLGAEVAVINNSPNGVNINEDCGSEHTAELREAVAEVGADLGLAFDGDGDRLVAVDESGEQLTGDQLLIILACMKKEDGTLRNDLIVSTIMSNMGLGVACRKHGLENHAAQVGDRHVVEEMRRLGAVLGGEESGHTVFLDHHSTGDGVLTGIQLAAAMLKAGKPLSELRRLMDVFPQKLINVEVKGKPDLRTVPAIVSVVEEAERDLGDRGRVLVRYSGTESICRVMVEGPSVGVTEKHAARIAEVVKGALG